MIPKLNRFHGHNALNTVYRQGKAVRSDYISLRYAPSRRGDYRLAVVVSKKVSKSAVVRNRIRRRVYEIIRLYRKTLEEPLGYDLVISVFDERAATISAVDLAGTLHRMLEMIER